MDENGRDVAEDPAPWSVQSRVGVHLRGHRLQPRADAEPAVADSSIRISPGRSVSGPLKTGRWSTYSPARSLCHSLARGIPYRTERISAIGSTLDAGAETTPSSRRVLATCEAKSATWSPKLAGVRP